MKRLLYILVVGSLFLPYSCKKDDTPIQEEGKVNPPTSIQIMTAADKVTISGKSDLGSEVTFQYDGNNGQVLRTIKADASGNFSFSIDQLVGYEQKLIAYATKADKQSTIVSLEKVPAKAAYAGGWNHAKQLMEAHRWKSDQTRSRIIVKQTASTPPFDMFATVAQKYFDFKADGTFHFQVTSPLQFTHTTGTWSMDINGVTTINTVIPLGAMQINQAQIQQLNTNRLELLVNISDGTFLLSFEKE